MAELFDDLQGPGEDPLEAPPQDAPLADRMRPRNLAEYAGQAHLVGESGALREALSGRARQSLILWGPPGTGKTTLARLIAAESGLAFVPYSAVLSGIKEIRAVMAEAARRRKHKGRGTLLFVDEIHRFNKAQQDAFLPHVERGDILLIGATTENPSFEVRGALLSRVRTLMLEPLPEDELVALLRRALEDERGLGGSVQATDEILRDVARAADGDARRALTLLESAAELAAGGTIDRAILKQAAQHKTLLYDKSGEEHYNLISALHKSIRNSDEDATLYWLTRMMMAGEDGRYLARRLMRMAVEDIGLADPRALEQAVAAAVTFERMGYPEAELALAQAAVYLARAPKSNALYRGLAQAKEDVERTAADPVPLHLRNAVTHLMRDAGYADGYRYAHDDPAAKGEMTCLPEGLVGRRYLEEPDRAEGGE